MGVARKICVKCGKAKNETEFFKMKGGERCDMCKSCLTMYVDNRRPDTFKWILKKFDMPYIEKKWIEMANKRYLQNPAQFGPMSVIGTYMRTMNMDQYAKYGYEDTDYLNDLDKKMNTAAKKAQEELGYNEKYEAELEKKFEDGEISESEYKTLSRKAIIETMRKQQAPKLVNEDGTLNLLAKDKPKKKEEPEEKIEEEIQDAEEPQEKKVEEDSSSVNEEVNNDSESAALPVMENSVVAAPVVDVGASIGTSVPANQFIPDMTTINEQDIQSDLTPDDIKYLSLKWGLLYKPSEWVKMEELYQKYAADYELSTDRQQVLKTICKTDLKMNQAIDVGDTKTFKDLQAANDQLRKSAKFTDSQKQEEKKRDIDSIGELVAFVENHGGIIPMQDDPINMPQDKIDFIINDMKNYTDNLVKNELGLGDLIESYIKKLEENKTKSVEEIMAEGFNSDEEDVLTQVEASEFQEFQMREREEEAKRLAEQYGSE
mgnify:CR=1 FL=1